MQADNMKSDMILYEKNEKKTLFSVKYMYILTYI